MMTAYIHTHHTHTVGSDVHALIKELAIRRVQHRSETYSNESQYLAEGTEVARLRRRFSFCFTAGILIPHASPSLQTGGGACEHPTAPFARPGVCTTSASYPGVTGSEGQERANRVGGGNGDGNGDVNGHGDGSRAGTGMGAGTGTGVGTRRQIPDGNGDGNGDGSEDSSGDGNGDDDNGNGNENRIGEGGRKAEKRKKPQNSCRRRAGNGGDLGGKRKKCRKERVGSVADNPDDLKSNKEAGGGA